MNQSTGNRPFYNRSPWNLIIGAIFFFAVGISIAAATTPWILLVPLVLWAIRSIKRFVQRQTGLDNRGYFSHAQNHHWIYEERHGYSLAALILPLENTEPGHWELFIPEDAKWRATVPDWAKDRRKEIALRIAEAVKPRDFHLPQDLRDSDAGG